MPGTLAQTSAKGMCAHGGQMTAVGTAARVLLSGMPAVKISDTHMIAGCPLTISSKPQPCVTASQFTPASRVFIEGQPAVLITSMGIGKSAEQAPQGPVTLTVTQPRVIGI